MAIIGEAWLELKPKIAASFGQEAQAGIASPLAAVAAKAGAILGVAVVGKKVLDFFHDSTKAAIDAEKAVAIMTTTMTNIGIPRHAQEQVDGFLHSLSAERGVIEEELMPAFNRLIRFTQDAAEAEQLLSLAQNVSAGTGKDLTLVATALGKAHDGNISGLARLGVKIKDEQGNALSYNEVIKQLEKQFKGLGSQVADIDPFQKFHVAMHDLKIEVGDLLLPILRNQAHILKDDVLPPVKAVVEWVTKVNDVTGGWAVKGTLLGVTLLSMAVIARKLILMFQGLNETFLASRTAAAAAATATAVQAAATERLALTEAELAVAAAAANLAEAEKTVATLTAAGATTFLAGAELEAVAASEALAVAEGELAAAELAAGAAAVASRGPIIAAAIATGTALLPLAAAALAVVAVVKLWTFFTHGGVDASNEFKDAIEKQKLSQHDLIGSMQLWIDKQEALRASSGKGAHATMTFSEVTQQLNKDFKDILKDTPEYADRFLQVVAATSHGTDATKGWADQIKAAKAAVVEAAKAQKAYDEEIQVAVDATENLTAAQVAQFAQIEEGITQREESKKKFEEELKLRHEAVDKLADLVGKESALLATRSVIDASSIDVITAHVQALHDAIAGAFDGYDNASTYFQYKLKITGKDLFQFQQESLADFQGWMSNIGILMRAGVDEKIIAQLTAGGVEGNKLVLGYIDELKVYGVNAVNQMQDSTDSMFQLVIDAAGNVTRVLSQEARFEFALDAWRAGMARQRAEMAHDPTLKAWMGGPPKLEDFAVVWEGPTRKAPVAAPVAPVAEKAVKEVVDKSKPDVVGYAPGSTIPHTFPGDQGLPPGWSTSPSNPSMEGGGQVDARVVVNGNVYGVDDLNGYLDQRDAQLAEALAAGVR